MCCIRREEMVQDGWHSIREPLHAPYLEVEMPCVCVGGNLPAGQARKWQCVRMQANMTTCVSTPPKRAGQTNDSIHPPTHTHTLTHTHTHTNRGPIRMGDFRMHLKQICRQSKPLMQPSKFLSGQGLLHRQQNAWGRLKQTR